jgi:hypothetical protein
MALDATVGGGSADSYADLAEIKAYWDSVGFDYSAYSDTDIEQAARRAAAWLDGRYRRSFPGQRQYGRASGSPQTLEWPRSSALDVEGEAIPLDTIPSEVKNAQAEATRREVAGTTLSPDVTLGDTVTSESVGPISTEYAGIASVEGQRPILTAVDEILAPLFQTTRSTKFLMRA